MSFLFGSAYRFGGSIDVMDSGATYEAQDSPSFGFIWNHRHEANTQWEVFFSRQQTEFELSDPALADPVVDVELYTLQLGGVYLWEGDEAHLRHSILVVQPESARTTTRLGEQPQPFVVAQRVARQLRRRRKFPNPIGAGALPDRVVLSMH